MVYLAEGMREAAKGLKAAVPPDAERAGAFETMADALTVLGESWQHPRDEEIDGALETLDRLADFAAQNDFQNYALLQQTLDAHPELENMLEPDDRNRGLAEHLGDVSGFFSLGMEPQLESRRRDENEQSAAAERQRQQAEQERQEQEREEQRLAGQGARRPAQHGAGGRDRRRGAGALRGEQGMGNHLNREIRKGEAVWI